MRDVPAEVRALHSPTNASRLRHRNVRTCQEAFIALRANGRTSPSPSYIVQSHQLLGAVFFAQHQGQDAEGQV